MGIQVGGGEGEVAGGCGCVGIQVKGGEVGGGCGSSGREEGVVFGCAFGLTFKPCLGGGSFQMERLTVLPLPSVEGT